jgi:putative flippase GtrA
MSGVLRWLRFNLVGALGMALQLGSLAFLSRLAPGHYLLASAIAVELALLHNFVGHIHFTWRDRPSQSVGTQLLRFHLSNGLVSLIGNVALTRLLVEAAHLPLLAATLVAIACCSVLNFCIGDAWAFAAEA